MPKPPAPDNRPPRILFEDNHLLVTVKPAGLATMGGQAGEPTLCKTLQELLRVRDRKPGEAYLGVVSRLDKPTTGAIVFAKTSKAAARLSEQFRERQVEKLYWALVEGSLPDGVQRWEDRIAPAKTGDGSRLVPATHPDFQEADLTYRVLGRLAIGTWIEVRLGTGRKHQIRVQCGGRKRPIWGDSMYGARLAFPVGIGLHARLLKFAHPVTAEPLEFVAPLPPYWPAWVRKEENLPRPEFPEPKT